jgi:NitT/TauT family transport system substrate-binding protein
MVKEPEEFREKRMKERIAALEQVHYIYHFVVLFCTKPADQVKVEKLRLGFLADPLSSLLYIARDQGMFKRHGLDVSFENYEGGIYAMRDLVAGKVDVAVATEIILVFQGFKRADLRGVGAISTANNIEVIARRDRGIEKPADLRGKRAGVIKGTINDFFLNSFLTFNNIRPAEIQMVDLKPSEIVAALSEGKIDAGCLHPPFLEEAKKNLAGKALFWPAQGEQDYFFLMIAKDELIRARPRAISNLLKGLLEAEAFLKEHNKEAREIVARVSNLTPDAVADRWSKIRFRVRPIRSFDADGGLSPLGNRNKPVDGKDRTISIPDLEGLKKVKPEAVTIIISLIARLSEG